MSTILKLYNFYLSIIVINSISSLLTDEPEIIGIKGNTLKNFSLNAGESKYLNLTYNKNINNYVSFLSLDNLIFNIKSNKTELNIQNTTLSEIEVKNLTEGNLLVNITSEKNNRIEIINIINDNKSSYFEIESDDQKFNENKYNFLKFLDNKDKLKVEINFKKKYEGKLYYGIVHLASNNIKYVPRAFNFENGIKNIKEKDLEKDMTLEIKDIEIGKKDNKKNTAFICSIKTDEQIENYSVIINKDIMNNFLIGSIILALIFAVITFFLIRRKQNITKHVGDDFYDEKPEEEKDN